MNYYEHHIGDYAEATAHLTFIEDATYSRLIRKYYATENKTTTAGDKKDEQLSKEIFNFPSPPSDIAERRRFPRAQRRDRRPGREATGARCLDRGRTPVGGW